MDWFLYDNGLRHKRVNVLYEEAATGGVLLTLFRTGFFGAAHGWVTAP